MNQFNIRIATMDDALSVATVRHHAWQETYRGIVHDSFLDEMTIEESHKRWKQILSHKDESLFNAVIFTNENRIVGFVSGGKSRTAEIKVDGEIYALYLLKEFHGLGLGKKLFQYGVKQLMQIGCQSFCVFVLTENPALHFYNKFSPDIEETDSVDIGGVDYDETVFGWSAIKTVLA